MIISLIILSLLAVLTIALTICGIIYCRKDKDGFDGFGCGILTLIVFMVWAGCNIYTKNKTAQQEIYAFKEQKNYIETVVPTLSDLDNASITQTKLEYNTWLYKAQYEYQHKRWTTFYTSEVMELEEIK